MLFPGLCNLNLPTTSMQPPALTDVGNASLRSLTLPSRWHIMEAVHNNVSSIDLIFTSAAHQ